MKIENFDKPTIKYTDKNLINRIRAATNRAYENMSSGINLTERRGDTSLYFRNLPTRYFSLRDKKRKTVVEANNVDDFVKAWYDYENRLKRH